MCGIGFNRFNSAGGIPGQDSAIRESLVWARFQSLQQRGGYSRCRCKAGEGARPYRFNRFNSAGGIPGPCNWHDDAGLLSFNRFNSAGGIPGIQTVQVVPGLDKVSIASTARGVFQVLFFALRFNLRAIGFNRFNSAGGIPGQRLLLRWWLHPSSFNRFNSAGGIPGCP